MTDAFTWALSELRTEFRRLTGRSTTTDISDANCNKWINDYYVNHFPDDSGADKFDILITQALTPTDSGEYTLDSGVDRLDEPVTLDNDEITLYRDRELFFNDYPEQEQYVTDPTLAIGTSDTTKVKHSAFYYDIAGHTYYKASSEVDLTGSAIPSGKYGAWSLKINSAGTITVTAADDNATGYATPELALSDLDSADSASCFMGYVTVIKSDGAFTPATTALDATNVTDTYTDGRYDIRGLPEAALIFGQKLYVRPKSDDNHELRAFSICDRPTAFSGDTDAPADAKWGAMIALGAAMLYLSSVGELERCVELRERGKYLLANIGSDKIKRLLGQQVKRSY